MVAYFYKFGFDGKYFVCICHKNLWKIKEKKETA